MGDMPPAVTHDQKWLRAVHARLGEMTELLTQIRDHLVRPVAIGGLDSAVELREPLTPTVPPEPSPPGEDAEAAAETAVRAAPARRTTKTRKTTTKKEAG